MNHFPEPARVEFAPPPQPQRRLNADVCIVGAGAAGVAACVEAARLGLRVCLIDGLAQIGGQSVNGLIGTLCGFYSSGDAPYRLTYGFAQDVTDGLEAAKAIAYRRGRQTVIGLYDEQELAAIYSRLLLNGQTEVILGALLTGARCDGRRLAELGVQTRYGPLAIEATTFIDASGDAALASLAGARVQHADVPVYGTSMFSITGVRRPVPPRADIEMRLQEVAAQYQLERLDGFVFEFPGRDLCLVNLTHFQTPLDAMGMSRVALQARTTVDRVLAFLRGEFAGAFGDARVGSIGQPGVRQTRSIAALNTLRTADVRAGFKPADAIARCAWPIEFHGSPQGVYWEPFPDGHITWVPLSCMISRDIDNLIAAGRCIDAEPFALSAVRVIGPCMAMGAAAAAAACVGQGRLDRLDYGRLAGLVADNISRCDPAPAV
jgi:hypothetical protein